MSLPGKTINAGCCGIDKVAEKVAQLGDEMDNRLNTGAVENDDVIEKTAEEVQNITRLVYEEDTKGAEDDRR